MSQSKKAFNSVVIIIVFSLGGKFLGIFREILIGAKFGSGIETDTYLVALSAITLFTTIITKSINTTMIPVLTETEAIEGKNGKNLHANNLLNIISIISIILIILGYLLSPLMIKILAPGFKDTEQFNLAVILIRIGLPTILISGIQGVFRGYLQTEGSFTETAATSFPSNFTYIFYLIFLSSFFGIKGLMLTSVVAAISQVILQIYGIKKINFKYKFVLDIKDKYVKKILSLIPPILLSIGISDINTIIDRSMASTLVEGSISSLNYANKISGLITGLFISAITTVIYPMLSKEATKEDLKGLKKVIINGINIINLITIPSVVGMVILSNPIIKVVFERGAFDSTATYMAGGALVFTSMRMVPLSLIQFINTALYSLQDTKTPVKIGILAIITNITFNFILIKPMGHLGLALATTIATSISNIYLIYLLREKIGSFGFLNSIKCGVKSLLASLIMGIIVCFLHNFLSQSLGTGTLMELTALIGAIGVGVIIYFILIYLFRIEEVNWAIKTVKDKFVKK